MRIFLSLFLFLGCLTNSHGQAVLKLAKITRGVITGTNSSSGGGCTPSYANTGGTGDRTAIITVTTTLSLAGSGGPSLWVNGLTTQNSNWWNNQDPTGQEVRFDFLSGHSAQITEVTFYESGPNSQGVWQFQGSNDGSSWTSLGSTVTIGGNPQVITTMSANTIFYRYYRFFGISGMTDNGPFINQFTFKLCYL